MNYQLIHDQIIERAQERSITGYVERHHIIPKCLGGNNSKENLVKLTAREHMLVHLLLVKIYPDRVNLVRAAFMMSNVKSDKHKRSYKVGAREYASLRESYSKIVSKQWKGKNKIFSEEHRKNLSKAAKNRMPKTTEQRKSQSETMKKRMSSPEGVKAKAAISKAMSGKTKSLEHVKKVGAANKGRVYVYNSITHEIKKVKGDQLKSLLIDGWLKGRKPKQKA